jgi:hypothetical protein
MPELPPPLPPERRTVGQFVGETIRAYGDNFWRALPLGIPLALVDQACVHRSGGVQILIFWGAAPLIAAAYVWACAVVHDVPPAAAPFLLALLIYLPFPLLRSVFILPAVAWFALVGLAVPAALLEKVPMRAAFARGLELGRADFVHALGALATLVIVVGVGEITLTTLLRTQGQASARGALVLADVVLSPLLYLGGAMLYLDQAARLGARQEARRAQAGGLPSSVQGGNAAGGSEAGLEA